MSTLFMETTKIEPEQTVAQIQRVLGQYGVSAIQTEYDKGEVKAVFFKIKIADKDVPFRLPCRWAPIEEVLRSRVKNWPTVSTSEKIAEKQKKISNQAKRIAWRQILRWVEAQMALVETNMVKIQEVFMPYIQMNVEGKTLFESLEGSKFKLLENKG